MSSSPPHDEASSRPKLGNHTSWLLNTLNSLDQPTRRHIIDMCLFVLDQSQFQLKPEYRSNEPRVKEKIARLPLGEVLMRKQPTVENLRAAIGRLVDAGIAEPFLITSLYDFVSYMLRVYADPESRSAGDERLARDIEELKERPILRGQFSADEYVGMIRGVERMLSESETRLDEAIECSAAWSRATSDRQEQARFNGAWEDLRKRDLIDFPLDL